MQRIETLKTNLNYYNSEIYNKKVDIDYYTSSKKLEIKNMTKYSLILLIFILLLISAIFVGYTVMFGSVKYFYFFVVNAFLNAYRIINKDELDSSIDEIKSSITKIKIYNSNIIEENNNIKEYEKKIQEIQITISNTKEEKVNKEDPVKEYLDNCTKKCDYLDEYNKLVFLKKIKALSKEYKDSYKGLIEQNHQSGINLTLDTYSTIVNEMFKKIIKLDEEIDLKIDELKSLREFSINMESFDNYIDEKIDRCQKEQPLIRRLQ